MFPARLEPLAHHPLKRPEQMRRKAIEAEPTKLEANAEI
jgi:hypothetical protein